MSGRWVPSDGPLMIEADDHNSFPSQLGRPWEQEPACAVCFRPRRVLGLLFLGGGIEGEGEGWGTACCSLALLAV